MTPTDAQTEEQAKALGLDFIEDRTWHDVLYVCHECEESHRSVPYILAWLGSSVLDWDQEEFDLLKETVVYNFNRSRYYPTDFEPVPQPCPNCSDSVERGPDTKGSDTHARIVEKEEERADYVAHLARLCPEAWGKDNP